jgi:hypothetical protein
MQEGDPQTRGKFIFMDIVVGSLSKAMYKAHVIFDLLMMVITAGKERDKSEWCKIFMDAGFSRWKMSHVMGVWTSSNCIIRLSCMAAPNVCKNRS